MMLARGDSSPPGAGNRPPLVRESLRIQRLEPRNSPTPHLRSQPQNPIPPSDTAGQGTREREERERERRKQRVRNEFDEGEVIRGSPHSPISKGLLNVVICIPARLLWLS